MHVLGSYPDLTVLIQRATCNSGIDIVVLLSCRFDSMSMI